MNLNSFQLGVIGFFMLTLIVGTLIFAGILPGFRAPQGGTGGTVVWWGTLTERQMGPVLETLGRDYRDNFTVQYVVKDAATLEQDLLEALADGKGPDLITLSSDMLARQSSKLAPIPYSTLSKQSFRDTFVLGTHIRDWELYLGPQGALGLPLYVDPLMLYYNQDLLANAKLATVPKLWNQLATALPLLVKSDNQGNLTQSGLALGTFNNNNHAKDDLALLLMQAGSSLVARGASGEPAVTLKQTLGYGNPPAGEATAFFLRFVDPTNTLYAWNSSEPEARDAFLRGELALYLGWASERDRLSAQNPQLNFAMALPPQRETGRELTIGRFYALSILKSSQNPTTAYQVASLLSGPNLAAQLAAAAGLPPVRNDLLATAPSDPEMALLYQAAIITRDWLDPAREESAQILRRMVESVALGRADASRAINTADFELQNLLLKK